MQGPASPTARGKAIYLDKRRGVEAAALCVPGVPCHLVGDCYQVGNVQRLNRTVFGLTQSM